MPTFCVAYTTAGPRVAQTDLLSGAPPQRQVWEDRGGVSLEGGGRIGGWGGCPRPLVHKDRRRDSTETAQNVSSRSSQGRKIKHVEERKMSPLSFNFQMHL